MFRNVQIQSTLTSAMEGDCSLGKKIGASHHFLLGVPIKWNIVLVVVLHFLASFVLVQIMLYVCPKLKERLLLSFIFGIFAYNIV